MKRLVMFLAEENSKTNRFTEDSFIREQNRFSVALCIFYYCYLLRSGCFASPTTRKITE